MTHYRVEEEEPQRQRQLHGKGDYSIHQNTYQELKLKWLLKMTKLICCPRKIMDRLGANEISGKIFVLEIHSFDIKTGRKESLQFDICYPSRCSLEIDDQ
jgi:hypothetical protein